MPVSFPGIGVRFRNFWLGEEALSAYLFLLFVGLFLGPFTHSSLVRMLTTLFLSLLMVAGVASMSPRPGVRIFAGLVAFTAIVLRWMSQMTPMPEIMLWSSVVSLIFMVLLIMGVLYKVFLDEGPVTRHRIRGAIAAYILFGITWSILYGLIDQTLPHAFSTSKSGDSYSPERQEEIAYFSFVTLATLGYGDITPTHEISRMFTVTEALIGQLYPATLLARLISLEISNRRNGADPDNETRHRS